MHTFSIRHMTDSDFDLWATMRAELWPSENAYEHKKELSEFFQDKNFFALICIADNGDGVAFLEANIRPYANGCLTHPVPFLEGIWVHPEYRKRGIARAMVRELEKWMMAKGYKEIGSDALIGNTQSIEAHKSWGFDETERVVYFRRVIAK